MTQEAALLVGFIPVRANDESIRVNHGVGVGMETQLVAGVTALPSEDILVRDFSHHIQGGQLFYEHFSRDQTMFKRDMHGRGGVLPRSKVVPPFIGIAPMPPLGVSDDHKAYRDMIDNIPSRGLPEVLILDRDGRSVFVIGMFKG